jgi:predicted enzyme related to lactoylglutathione lyase
MLRLAHVTFACEDAAALAAFWGDVLGYDVAQRGDAWTAVPEGDGPSLRFRRMPKSATIELPVHLDVNVPDREQEVARLVGRGALIVSTRKEQFGDVEETWTVMRDPEGNGFCVQGPGRRPHPYLGNITFSCAEPRRVAGPFWSAALGWPEHEVPEDFLQMLRDAHVDVDRELFAYYAIRQGEGTSPRLLFQRREKSRPESQPIHVDLAADDRDAEVERLVGLGASIDQMKRGESRTWTAMRDPDGTAFCVA